MRAQRPSHSLSRSVGEFPRPEGLLAAAALAGVVLLLGAPGAAAAENGEFAAWLLGYSGTYTLEMHGDVAAEDYELPEIPLCPAGRCANVFTDGGNYSFSMSFRVLLGGEQTARKTKVTAALFRVDTTTGERKRLRSLTKRVKNGSAERQVNLDIAGITNDEQLVATVKAKKGVFTAGHIFEMTVALTFNGPS